MVRFTCNVKDLNSAIQRAKVMADATANPNYIMLSMEENKLRLAVTDGVIAYIEDVEVNVSENTDEFKRSVFETARLTSIIASGVPSDGLEAEPLEIEITKEYIKIQSEKYITIKETKKTVSKIIHKIVREDPDEDRRLAVFTRVRYKEDITDIEDYDTYDSGELIRDIAKMQVDDKKVNIYISASEGLIRSRSSLSIKCVHIPEKEYGVAMKYAFAAKVMDIFSRIGATYIKVNSNKDTGYMVMTDDENRCYVWYAMEAGAKGDKQAFDALEKFKIEDIKARVCKPAFIAGIDTMKLSDSDKVILEIVKDEDIEDDTGYEFKLSSVKGGSNVLSDVSIAIDKLYVADGHDISNFKVVINTTEIRSLVARCDASWVGFAFRNTDEPGFMKIVDMKMEEVTGEMKESAVYYMMVGA